MGCVWVVLPGVVFISQAKRGIRRTLCVGFLKYRCNFCGENSKRRVFLEVTLSQGVISWRASGDRQISLSASDERAFANFRVKNVVFTGTHFCAVLSMVGERAFVNFRKFVN